MKSFRFLFWGYVGTIVLLLLYSYTQVDLSLTLSRFSLWQVGEKFFQYIGYFNRPLSTALFLVILFLLFGFYGFFIQRSVVGKLSSKTIWKLIIVLSIVLFFSYNAFSYDFFNYIFDAKIFTNYHLNPYLYKALDFPKDPMLSFMHWTHRTYPYGPVWLIATIPLSFLGLQYFLPTFFLFKVLVVGSFLGSAYFLEKFMSKTFPKDATIALVVFALNPLVIIESLVSGHNDIFMMFLALLALYLLITKRYMFSFLILFLSIGTKFATIFLLPVFLSVFVFDLLGKKINWKSVFLASTILMIIPIIFATLRTTFQPWYFLFALPLGALVGKKFYIVIPTVILSFFFLLEYVPYLYSGNWDNPIPSILSFLTGTGIVVSVAVVLGKLAMDLLFAKKTR